MVMDQTLIMAKLYPLIKKVWADDPYLEAQEPEGFKKAIDKCIVAYAEVKDIDAFKVLYGPLPYNDMVTKVKLRLM